MDEENPAEPLSGLRDNIYYILDENGDPIHLPRSEVLRWGQWFEENTHKRVVAKTEIGNWQVSTVFLGINHSIFDGPPILYETMIFHKHTGATDHYMQRYPNKHAALAGHEQACTYVRQELHPELDQELDP